MEYDQHLNPFEIEDSSSISHSNDNYFLILIKIIADNKKISFLNFKKNYSMLNKSKFFKENKILPSLPTEQNILQENDYQKKKDEEEKESYIGNKNKNELEKNLNSTLKMDITNSYSFQQNNENIEKKNDDMEINNQKKMNIEKITS